MDYLKLSKFYRDGLLNDVIPFWTKHSVDPDYGGFFTSLDSDGSIIDTDKGVWQQGRFVWLLGELYNNLEADEQWLGLAKQGADFMTRCCFDDIDGRMWFHVNREGKPIRKRRYSYSESFASIAFGELAKATGDPFYFEMANQTFARFLAHEETCKHPKFTKTRQTRSIGFPMITIGTAQQLRASINLMEADGIIDSAIGQLRQFFYKSDIECVMETVGVDGELLNHFEGRLLNPGHAIEAAWFVMAEGEFRDERSLIEMGCKMLDWMWSRSWDQEFGGILYHVDVDDMPVAEYWHDMKFWWPHAEAIIATLLAYQLTGDTKYQQWHSLVHQWAYSHFPDPDHGEWFGYLRRDGAISTRLKGNLWKGPFHLPRMQWIGSQIAAKIANGEST